MNDIKYIGEHLWVGELGHFFIILAFVSAILSCLSYFFATKKEDKSWSKLGRYGFYTHGISLICLILTIFYAMYNHMYEYAYVFDHVSEDLPLKYILSAFWEGQEGSFMLWMFWHIVLGIIITKTTDKWEAPVMCTIASAEVILMTMILGIHLPLGEEIVKIGSNPTVLIRQMTDAPIFANADYLQLIKGRGLNPLLQNYWMTIHPPTLFLGFASTIVPFAFAFAGLWKNEHKDWLKPALGWSLFSAGILGTGLLMGSLWAYVALSFGGYWAWDPVENASLVPWITMVAGIHVHLISRNTGHATRAVYFFYLLSFVLILYSTFLTRSGILGDTSAHAFTEMGLEWQLVFLVAYFFIVGMVLLLYRYNNIKTPEKEEALYSREFWMFIGSLVLLFSGVLIEFSTSLPVYNKIMTYFDPGFLGKVIKDPIPHYNKYQLWVAIFVSILSAVSVFLRYKGINWELTKHTFYKKMGIITVTSICLTFLISLWIQLFAWQYITLCFAGAFIIISNVILLLEMYKNKTSLLYSTLSHLGFGLLVVGTLASGLNQKYISTNPFVFKGMFTDEDLTKYVQLIKGKPLFSQGYFITYQSDTLIGRERHFDIQFQEITDSLKVVSEFHLHPNSVYSNDFTKVAAFNPDTKHYFHKDIFSCVVAVPPSLESVESANAIEDSLKYISYAGSIKDTFHIDQAVVTLDSINFNPSNQEYLKNPHDTGFGIILKVVDNKNDTSYSVEAAIGLNGALMYSYPATIDALGFKIKVDETTIDNYFTDEGDLIFKEYTLKLGEIASIDGYEISISGFDKDPKNKNYQKETGDIAVGAELKIENENGFYETAKPLYIIRKNQPMSIKHYSPQSGLHIRFSNIDPVTETFSFKIAKDKRENKEIKFAVAKDVPRGDYLILMASIFPGINLIWLGGILMMIGLFLAAIFRFRSKAS